MPGRSERKGSCLTIFFGALVGLVAGGSLGFFSDAVIPLTESSDGSATVMEAIFRVVLGLVGGGILGAGHRRLPWEMVLPASTGCTRGRWRIERG